MNHLTVTREALGRRQVDFDKVDIEWQRDKARQNFGESNLRHLIAMQNNEWLLDLDFFAHSEPPDIEV